MDLKKLIKRVLLEDINLQLQQLKDKYVGDGKLFSENEFKQLEEVTGNKWYLIAWLTKRVAMNIIKKEDLYKWKEYFQIFDKNKKKFKFQDLNLFKTAEDIQNFIETVIQIREGDVQFEDLKNTEYFLSKSEIEKLTSSGKNKYLGVWKPTMRNNEFSNQGYQIFEIYEPTQENWKVYRDLLGRCKGRDKGAKIEICTIGDYRYFKNYLHDPKGSGYVVLFNLNDSLSPYQLHVESEQFMNKNDVERYRFNKEEFFKWLSSKSERYNVEQLAKYLEWEIPMKDKGYKNDKGKQGIWVTYDSGKIDSIRTYKNNIPNGPAENYTWGKLTQKGTLRDKTWIGDYKEFYEDGDLKTEGTFDNVGEKVGVWKKRIFGSFGSKFALTNYDDYNEPVSGITLNGTLRVVADKLNSDNHNFVGKAVIFYPSGSVKAIGRLTPRGKFTGPWIIYNSDGSIKTEGNFSNDKYVGKWIFFFKSKNVDYSYSVNFDKNNKVGKLYNKKGEFIKKLPYSSDKVPSVRKLFQF